VFDEQRYLRGFLLILNIRLTKMLGFSGLDVSPAPIFVDARNADPVTIAISSKTRGALSHSPRIGHFRWISRRRRGPQVIDFP